MMISQAELELHTERKGVIGGSDVGALWNLDFGCRRKLGYEKTSAQPDFPEIKKPEFERGKYLEEVVARLYADKTLRKVRLAPKKDHPVHPYMVVHMDRIVEAPEHAGEGYLEIKVANYRTFKKFKAEGLRESYILQVQHGLNVTGYQWGSYAVLCPDPWDFKWFDVERDEELIQRIMTEEIQFMSDVAHGVEFARLEPTDNRCLMCPFRKTCHGDALLDLIPPGEMDEDLLDRPDLLPLAAEVQELQTMKGDLEAMINEANAQMNVIIGDAAGARYPGGRTLKIRSKGRKTWDSKALWALWESATPRLKEMLAKYNNNGKEGKPPAPFLRHYWTGDK